MGSEFTLTCLADVARITSGKRPPSTRKQCSNGTSIPIVGGGGVSGFTEAALFNEPILVTGRVGTLGKLFAISEPSWPSDNALVVLANREKIGWDFLRYALQSVIHRAVGMNRGAANPLVTQTDLGRLPIPTAPITVQYAISSFLRSLDDRIDLLRQTNATLEAIAQALFKSWFVGFDPVHAKAEGREPEAMDAVTAALFPSEFEESERGLIPKGWRDAMLREVFEINPRRPLRKGALAPYLDMAGIPTSGHVPAPPIERKFSSGTKFHNGDTLLARITPCLENGKTAHVDFLDDGQIGWGSTEFIVLKPKAPLTPYFGYLLARQSEFRAFAIQAMTGTSGRQRVGLGQLEQFLLTIPDEAVAAAFGSFVEPIRKAISGNAHRAVTLAALRDNLLPRLISGKLRLPEVMEIIEAAPRPCRPRTIRRAIHDQE